MRLDYFDLFQENKKKKKNRWTQMRDWTVRSISCIDCMWASTGGVSDDEGGGLLCSYLIVVGTAATAAPAPIRPPSAILPLHVILCVYYNVLCLPIHCLSRIMHKYQNTRGVKLTKKNNFSWNYYTLDLLWFQTPRKMTVYVICFLCYIAILYNLVNFCYRLVLMFSFGCEQKKPELRWKKYRERA